MKSSRSFAALCAVALTITAVTATHSADPITYTRYDLTDKLVIDLPSTWTINQEALTRREDLLVQYDHSPNPTRPRPDSEFLNADAPSASEGRVFVDEKAAPNTPAPPVSPTQLAAYDRAERQRVIGVAKSVKGELLTWNPMKQGKVGAFTGFIGDYTISFGPDKLYVHQAKIRRGSHEIRLEFNCPATEMPAYAPVIPHIFDSFRLLATNEKPTNLVVHRPSPPSKN